MHLKKTCAEKALSKEETFVLAGHMELDTLSSSSESSSRRRCAGQGHHASLDSIYKQMGKCVLAKFY